MTLAPRRSVLAAALTATFALAGGCGSEEPDLPTPVAPRTLPASPIPTSTLDPAKAEAVDEVLAVYEGYLAAYIELATSGEPPQDTSTALLLQYAEQEIAIHARNEVLQNFIDERVFTGELSWTLLEPAEVDLDRTVDGESAPLVTLRICVDGSTWELVDKDTGDPVGEPPGRYVSIVSAEWREEREFGPDGWGLHEQDDDDRSQPC